MHSPWARVADSASTSPPPQPERTPAACDRSCLDRVADGYMRALVAHDFDEPPWADRVRFTENGVPMAVGDALWGSVSSASDSAVRAGDPSSGNVVWLGTVAEHGQPAYYAMRLRARSGKISEIESIVARSGNAVPYVSPALEIRQDFVTTAIPASERESSRRLSALVGEYYAASGQGSATFDPQCVRSENGVAESPCRAAANAMHVMKIREWHLALADPERGIAVATGYCDRPDPDARAGADEAAKAPIVYPHSAAFIEVFQIRRGKIERIESVSTLLPYLMHSPWSEAASKGGPK